jgi:hypothetical protein
MQAVVHAVLGQREGSAEQLKQAETGFQVGATAGCLSIRLPFITPSNNMCCVCNGGLSCGAPFAMRMRHSPVFPLYRRC